jgi:hypothetical protein
MTKIIRLTESDLVTLVNRVVKEQLIKRRDPKIDADSNKYWQQLKSKLYSMGFKLTFSKDDSEASPNPINVLYNTVGKREIMTLEKNGYKVDVQWPGGAIDAGIVEPKDCKIDIHTETYKPNFGMLMNKVKSLVSQGPGFGGSDYEGGMLNSQNDKDNQFFQFGVRFQPENIAKMITQLIPLLK